MHKNNNINPTGRAPVILILKCILPPIPQKIIRSKIKFLIIAAILTLPYGSLFAQSSGGGYAESYLIRDVSARAIALGGAYTAVSNDPATLFYNPAGLVWLSNRASFVTSYSFLEFGRTQSSIAWGQTMFDNFGFGFGINSYTTGQFTARNELGVSLGTYTDWQYSIVGGAAYNIEFASIGLNAKYLSHSLVGGNFGANGFSLDLGSKFNVMDMFSFGLAIQNFAGLMFWNTGDRETDMLPFTVRAGVAMEYGLNDEEYTRRSTVTGEPELEYIPATRYILVSADAVLTQYEEGPSIIIGVEAVPHELIAFRAGINILGDKLGAWKFFPMTVWGGGISLRPKIDDLPFKMNIDYTVAHDYLSSNNISHHLSIFIEL